MPNIAWLAVITAIAALITSTVLNILFRMEYYQMGVNFIYNYQSNYQTSAITIIQNLISILGNTYFIVAFLILVHIIAYRKLNTIVYIFYIVINAYLIAVEKQAYQDPRPFYYNSNIQALQWTCPRSYGFPSGHSWISVLLYQPVISDLIGTRGWKKILLFWIILTGTLIPISRQYLGSHTSDQVTSGVLHSMAALIMYKYWLELRIYRLLINALKGISKKLIFSINTLFFLISVAIPMILYSVNVDYRTVNPDYITRMNAGCSKNYLQIDLEKEAGTAGSIIGLIFGFVYGLQLSGSGMMQNSYTLTFENNNRYSKLCFYLLGQWNFKNSCLNVLKYLLLYILFGGIFIGVLAYAIPSSFSNFYGTYILQTLGFCLFGMAITCFIPALLSKFEVIHFQHQSLQARTVESINTKRI